MKASILGKNGPKVINLNRRKAIRERCLNCAGWIYKEVACCSFMNCPLFPFRSGQGRQIAKARAQAIRKYCLWCTNGQHGEVSKCPSTGCPLFSFRKIQTDRSTEIKSLPKKDHIEPFNRDKIELQYLSMESNGNERHHCS